MLVYEHELKEVKSDDIISIVCGMATTLNNAYICDILSNKKNELVFYSFENSSNTNVDILNCPCSLIYKTCRRDKTINIYILFIATAYKFRKLGYASIFMSEFIQSIRDKYQGLKKVNIILDSVIESVTFYEHIGFKWTTLKVNTYYKQLGLSKNDGNEHFIMVYKVF